MLEIAHMEGVVWLKTAGREWRQVIHSIQVSVGDCIRTEKNSWVQLIQSGVPFLRIGAEQSVLLTAELLSFPEANDASVKRSSLDALSTIGIWPFTGGKVAKE